MTINDVIRLLVLDVVQTLNASEEYATFRNIKKEVAGRTDQPDPIVEVGVMDISDCLKKQRDYLYDPDIRGYRLTNAATADLEAGRDEIRAAFPRS